MSVFIRIEGLDPEDLLDADTDHEESAAHDLADRVFNGVINDYPGLFEDLTGVIPVLDEDEHARLVEVSNIETPTERDKATDSPVVSFGPLDRDDLEHVGDARDLDADEYDWIDACGYAYVRVEEEEPEAMTDGGVPDAESGLSAGASATLPTEGDEDDYVIVLNGEPMEWLDAGGFDADGYVMGFAELDGEHVEVTVGYGRGGVSGCSLHFRDRDESHSLTEQSAEEDQFLEFYADEVPDVSACVEILPENEVFDE